MGIFKDIFSLADDIVSGTTDFLGLTDYRSEHNMKVILKAYEKGEINEETAKILLKRHCL